MELNPVIERFYLSALKYAGLKYEDGVICNIPEKLGEFSLDGKSLSLPYYSQMKNPKGRLFFHPLNENYATPEVASFDLYRKRLTLEVNLRLCTTIVNLIAIASDVQIQQKIKNPKLVDIVCQLGEIDNSVTEAFMASIKNAKAKHDEGFLVDFYLKKSGEVDGVPYAAVGKVNFNYLNELRRSLEEKDKDYRVFGCKMRKKDVLALIAIFTAIFPDIDTPFSYDEGTDNKIFRYLNILLKVSYLITNRLNHLSTYIEELNESCLDVDGMRSDHDWIETLEPLYEMSREIRLIPNQSDVIQESNKLHVNEQKASEVQTQQNIPQEQINQAPQFNPNVNQPVPNQQSQVQQPPRQLTSEEILEQRIAQRNMNMGMLPNQMYPQMGMMSGMIPMQQPAVMPDWMARANAAQQPQMQGYPQMQQPMPPQMYHPQMPQMPMGYQQPQMPMQMYPNQMGYPQQPQMQPGLQINPALFNRMPGY